MTNKLKEEKSPYLKQHKDNPVNWFAWNKQSLEQAKKDLMECNLINKQEIET